jgi:hypothetical protein
MAAPANVFKIFRIIHIAQMLSLALFAALALVIENMDVVVPVEDPVNRTLQIIVVILSVGLLFLGFRVFRNKILAIRAGGAAPSVRLAAYKAACILWWAMIEGPGLVAFACFIITANYAFFALGVFHLMLLIMFAPRRDNIILLLGFTSHELKELEA